MNNQIKITFFAAVVFCFVSCTPKSDKKTFWIYTSLYKDTIAEVQPQLEAKFPGIRFQFYQAGSEEVAAKVQAEILTGKIQADLLISSDRFWYEDLANQGRLQVYQGAETSKIKSQFKHPHGMYSTLSLPVMVIAFNSEAVPVEKAPKSFLELKEKKWKDQVSIGSPLASGTSFTTVAFLVKKYGWDYIQALRSNNFMAEGGNSGVIRRLQSKERPVGIVLLENVLRLKESDPRIKWIIPSDGVVLHSNVLALVKKEGALTEASQIADWFFSEVGQKAMTKSYMYSPVEGNTQPEGAPPLDEILKNAQVWDADFISETMKSRESIKDQFSKIVF